MKSSHDSDTTTAISDFIEAELRDNDGQLLGIVDELLINLHSGRIEYVLAAGAHGNRLRFPWSSITLDGAGFRLHRAHPRLVKGSSNPEDE